MNPFALQPPGNAADHSLPKSVRRNGRIKATDSMRQSREEIEDYDFIINLVYERARIRLNDGKHQLIKARLGKRMRHHGHQTLAEYINFLKNSGTEEEITHVVDALTTNFTHFLREKDHFDFLVQTGIPKTLESGQRRFSVWSAACATGEEPYSIGFYLSHHFPPEQNWDWKILATDISTKALGKAQEAIYPEDRLEAVPPEWRRNYFQKGFGKWLGNYRIKDSIRARITFRNLNLLGQYDVNEQFTVIFCRNVMIYFDRPTQEELVKKLSRFLVPKGYLLIGHSESLTGLDTGLKCLRPSVYQKE